MNPSTERYWAADDTKKCIEGALARRKTYREWLVRSGKLERINRALSTFYGYAPNGDGDSAKIQATGEQGEIADLVVNHFAALVRQGLVLITEDKAAFKTVAGNTDYKSLAQAALGDGLLEHYDRKLNVSDIEYEAAFRAMLMTEGHVSVTWDAEAGSEYAVDPDTKRPVHEGDCQFRVFHPLEVAYDVRAQPGKLPWMLVEPLRNKWDLAAQYPELATKILSAQSEKDELQTTAWAMLSAGKNQASEDLVTVYELFVSPSPASPQGRLVIFMNADCCLFDGPLPYDELPVYSMAPDSTIGNATGHTGMFDLLGLQQAVDMTATIATTNLQAGGVANYWGKDGTDINVTQLAGGLNFITSQEKPEVLDGVKTQPEVAAWAQLFVGWMQNLSGINAAIRGEPDKGMPAQAMAFLQAAAIQYHSRLQASFTKLREKVRTANLKLLKRYANTQRVALISGKANSFLRKEFTADDLKDIDRVTVETVNPILRTMQGRKAIADELLQRGAVRPTQYITFLNSGRYEPLFEGEEANLLRIRRNKELLQDGIGLPPIAGTDPMTGMPLLADDGQQHVRPLKYDTHWLDIPEYLSVLAQPDARENPAVVEAVTGVVEYADQLWNQMPPQMQALLGCPAPLIRGMPMMGAPVGPPAPGAASGAPPPMGGDASATMAPPSMQGDAPKLPSVPKTPGGEQPPMPGVTA